jgi:hypothetical protein
MISSTACQQNSSCIYPGASISAGIEVGKGRVQFLLVINTFDIERPVCFSTLPEVDPFPERFWQQLDCQSRHDTWKQRKNSSKVTVKNPFFFLTIANVFSRGLETFSKN